MLEQSALLIDGLLLLLPPLLLLLPPLLLLLLRNSLTLHRGPTCYRRWEPLRLVQAGLVGCRRSMLFASSRDLPPRR